MKLCQCLRSFSRSLVNHDHLHFQYRTSTSFPRSSLIARQPRENLLKNDGKTHAKIDATKLPVSSMTAKMICSHLKKCAQSRDIERGIQIHRGLSREVLQDSFVQTSLIHFYMQCRQVDQAEQIFSSIENKTIFMYGALFKGYISNQFSRKVLEEFSQLSIRADEVLMTLVLNACAKCADDQAEEIGKKVLKEIPRHFLEHNRLVNAAIDMLMRFGDINDAERLFQGLTQRTHVSYGTMIQGYMRNHLPEKALDLAEKIPLPMSEVLYTIIFNLCESSFTPRSIALGKKLFETMPKSLVADLRLAASTLKMLMKFGQMEEAETIFSSIYQKNTDLYTAMIDGYHTNDRPDQCLKLFETMQETNIPSNETIYIAVISACGTIGIRSICEKVVKRIPQNMQQKTLIRNALISMWGRSGNIDQANSLFQSIHEPDIVAYTSMINAYGRSGQGLKAIDLFEKIPIDQRDSISYICALNACSHSGLVEKARSIYNEITTKTEQIVTVMIDCLSRLFLFDEAQQLLDEYERSNPPSIVMHMAILSGARIAQNALLSKKIFDRMKLLFEDRKSDMIGASVLVSNTLLSVGEETQAQAIRDYRNEHFGRSVKHGMSWTVVDGILTHFEAHDRSHPRTKEIYAEMDRLNNELQTHGYKFDNSWIARPVRVGETAESVLSTHSERLAIAYNFVHNPKIQFIEISKNLRICGDCHSAMKLIAKIRNCHIQIRDANRFHLFQPDGTCSCREVF